MNTPLIVCHQLCHRYQDTLALNDLTLSVAAGGPIGLVGPNGAGKSTLLNLLAGFLTPTSGTIRVYDQPPGSVSLIGKVAALPQDARLDPRLTIQAQLLLYARLQGFTVTQARDETHRVLNAVSLPAAASAKPHDLSHGMVKRIALAQALIGSPSLVLLDEPTAGLDPVNLRTIRNLIAALSATTTFIISSHDLTELDRVCDRVLLLDNGRLQNQHTLHAAHRDTTRFITVQIDGGSAAEVLASLQAVTGVTDVSQPQAHEFIVRYDVSQQPDMDITLLATIRAQHWQCRQLTHGKTLEETLFFGA